MSFEGYFQILCRSGHAKGADCFDEPNFDGPEKIQFEEDGEEYDHPLWHCYDCNELAGWYNLVDETNGSHYEGERIDNYIELEIATKPDVCTCECGYVHPKGGDLSTYHIPKKGGHIVNGGSIHAPPSGVGDLTEDERRILKEGEFDLEDKK